MAVQPPFTFVLSPSGGEEFRFVAPFSPVEMRCLHLSFPSPLWGEGRVRGFRSDDPPLIVADAEPANGYLALAG